MTPADLKAKLDELFKLPAETEWVEFKEAKSNLDSDDLGKYFAALCNEANLKDQPVGWLVFGVQDKPRKVVGSQYRPSRASLDSLKQEIELEKYDAKVVLEALNNCIAHQDYSRQSRIIVVEKADRLIFENAGGFFEGSLDDYLFRDRIPRHYRNRLLAEAMVSLDMIDALGMGIKRMFLAQRNRYFPLPEYDFSQPDTVRMEIMGKLIDENYSRILIEKAVLDLGTVVALDKVQKRKPLTPEELKHLRRLKLVEGRAPNVFVASRIAAITGDKAQFIRNRAFDTAHYKQMILDFIREFGSATRKDVDDLLRGKLSDLLTEKQKGYWIGNLLSSMARKDGSIRNQGARRSPQWVLVKR